MNRSTVVVTKTQQHYTLRDAVMRLARLALTAGLALSTGGCAPIFSEQQSARVVGVGRAEVTSTATANFFTGDGETDHVENHYGIQVATGVHERLDLRLRYVRAGGGVNAVGFAPKLSLLEDRLALAVPVGFAFGEDVNVSKTWEFHPTLLFTQQLAQRADLNLSAKSLIRLEGDTLWGFNVGLGLGDRERWVVRPEVGLLFNPGDEGQFLQASLGFTWFAGSRR